jgi:hypothetical protein
MSKVDCDICCTKFNKSKNKPIDCPLCNKAACLNCVKRYLLDTTKEYHCMFCKNKWNRDVLVDKLPKVFISNDLRQHQENLIIDLEKARLPEAQVIAENKIREEKRREIREIQSNLSLSEYKDNEYSNQLINILAKNYGLDNVQSAKEPELEKEKKVKREFIKACPNSDCRGFIDKRKWSCGLCNSKVCKECYEIVDDDELETHTCDPAILESNKLIEKDTKPCPNCNSLIHKLSGCDQMFCTLCHTAFSWSKGTIERGVIHNPHYFQWKMSHSKGGTAAEAGDPIVQIELCNENLYPDFNLIYPILHKLNSKTAEWIPKFLRYFIHIREVTRPIYQTMLAVDEKMEINVKYIMGNISKTEWKKQLYDTDKRQHLAQDIVDLIDMASTISGERFRQLIQDCSSSSKKLPEKIQNIYLSDLNNLVSYFENELENIKKRYLLKNNILSKYVLIENRDKLVIKDI